MISKLNKIFIAFLALLALSSAFGASAQEGTILYSPDIDSPRITSVDVSILNFGGVKAEGRAMAFFTIFLTIKDVTGNSIYSIRTSADKSGNWSGNFDQPLKRGKYYIEAISQNSDGIYSYPTKSDFFNVQGPFAVIIAGLSIIVVVLTFAFAAGWYVSRWAEIKRYRRILLSERDVEALYNIAKKDADRALKNISDGPMDDGKINEIKFLLERINDNLDKINKYVIKGIRVIGKYDIVKKIDKSSR